MIYGTIYRGLSREAAQEEAGRRVLCLDCLNPTEVKVEDYSFDDNFGGVKHFELVSQCCEGEFRSEGCDYCGSFELLIKTGEHLLCSNCKREEEKEEKEAQEVSL